MFLKNDRGQESKNNLRWSKDQSYRITFSNYIYVEGILLPCTYKNYIEKLMNQQTMLTQIILKIMWQFFFYFFVDITWQRLNIQEKKIKWWIIKNQSSNMFEYEIKWAFYNICNTCSLMYYHFLLHILIN